MNCQRLHQVLDAYQDGELDRATGDEIVEHLAGCAACNALKSERDDLRQRVHLDAPYFKAPGTLKQEVLRSLHHPQGGALRHQHRPSWLQAGVFVMVAALASGLAGYWAARPLPENSLREQVVTSHVAALGAARGLTDVASSDRHVVKPWFQGKLDFAPVVRDLSGEGFALLGARLDHVADRQAAAIVYRVRQHLVNLFVWRAAVNESAPIRVSTLRGFSIATWSEDGLWFAAISDVDVRDLERFARLVHARP